MIQGENGELIPNYDVTLISFREGDILKGRVVKIDKDEVLIDIGYKSEGVIPLNELSVRNNVKPEDIVEVGQVIEIMVLQKEDQDGRLLLSKKRAEIERSFDRIEKVYENGETVEGEVIECVKGGLIVDIGLRGFLPASLVDVKKTRDLASYIGENVVCKIVEVNRSRNNVVLSRKAIIEEERKEHKKRVLESIEVGQIRKGVITSIADFGAFVDVDGVDGLIHISELSWNHIKHPSEVVQVNQEVNVEILDIDYEKQRLSLGLKQTQKDPWIEKIKKYNKGDVVAGKVTRIVKFGLFAQIEEGLEGLVHISELSDTPVRRPSDVAKIGDEVLVRIIDIDYDRRRMAFSIKQVKNPVTEEVSIEEKSPGPEADGKKENLDSKGGKTEKVAEGLKEAYEAKSTKEDVEPREEFDLEKDLEKEIGELSPEEKRETIKKLLKEMKDEANL
ncbi:MAG: 30S ribosomal protein S1 [Actinobacteria bacterium]|nr:30S ribosomal protein S1 [Actinomycetota bacterium]